MSEGEDGGDGGKRQNMEGLVGYDESLGSILSEMAALGSVEWRTNVI